MNLNELMKGWPMSEETYFQVLSGVESIGSNIVYIRRGKYGIVTDFGAMRGAAAEDLVRLDQRDALRKKGQLPDLDALYEESDLQLVVCISHLHLDHIGSLYHLRQDIPVLCSQLAAEFYQDLKAVGYLPDYRRDFIGVAYEEPYQHGPFTITFHASDHDSLGVSAIFIEAEDLKLIHSGDFQLTGFYPERVARWASQARDFRPDILFIEGTSFSHIGTDPDPVDLALEALTQRIDSPSEFGLLARIQDVFARYPHRLFAFNGYPQNVERVARLAQLGQAYRRQLVAPDGVLDFWKKYTPEDIEVLPYSAALSRIQDYPEDYVLLTTGETVEEIFQCPPGIFLHSNGTPLGSYWPGYEAFVRGVIDQGWTFYFAGASGHAGPRDLVNVAYLVQAKTSLAWHSFQPQLLVEALRDHGLNAHVPHEGQVYVKDSFEEETSHDAPHLNDL